MLPQLRYGSTAASSGISNERIPRRNASTGGNEMMRATEREHATALQRKVDKRLANLEERIQALREDGQPTIEAERLLQLMHRSRACMQEQADLFSKSLSLRQRQTTKRLSSKSDSLPRADVRS
jgi:hypothetical protein